MQRHIINQLLVWKNSPRRKPLILEGARQVGKTYLLKELFGAKYYDNMAYLNLQNPSPELKTVFTETLDPARIIPQLELLLGIDIKPGKTLIIFDEIQELPRVLTSLKYFYENAPEYHVVVAGSLLGVFLQHPDVSFPVGKVDTMRLEPMNFAEFIEAKGQKRILNHLYKNPDDNIFDSKLSDFLREYMVVGGMPATVQSWVEAGDISMVDRIQQEILSNYRNDFGKHSQDRSAIRIGQVFDSLPAQFAKSQDKFVYGLIKNGARAREYELAIEWLVNAGIVRRVFRTTSGKNIPLKAYEDRNAFKLYFLDIGLFRQLAEIPSSVVLQQDAIFNQFNGLMAEQYVLQELMPTSNLYYWTSGATAEVDFVTQIDTQIVPIEVKSGNKVQAKSLRVYQERYLPQLALRFWLKPNQFESNLLNISLYKTFLLSKYLKDYLAKL